MTPDNSNLEASDLFHRTSVVYDGFMTTQIGKIYD